MSLSFGIMIEAQEGLTWDRWRRLAGTVEDADLDAIRFMGRHVLPALRR